MICVHHNLRLGLALYFLCVYLAKLFRFYFLISYGLSHKGVSLPLSINLCFARSLNPRCTLGYHWQRFSHSLMVIKVLVVGRKAGQPLGSPGGPNGESQVKLDSEQPLVTTRVARIGASQTRPRCRFRSWMIDWSRWQHQAVWSAMCLGHVLPNMTLSNRHGWRQT